MPALVPIGSAVDPASLPGSAQSLTRLSHKIVIQQGQFGTGGFATADIYDGEEVGSVGYDDILSETYAVSTPVGRAAIGLRSSRPIEVIGRTVLYLVMISERHDPAAKFYKYLNSLATDYDDAAAAWTEEERSAFLACTNLESGAAHRAAWLRRCYDAFFPTLFESHPALFPRELFSFEVFRWAHSAFSSRCFPHLLSVRPGGAGTGTGAGQGADSRESHDAASAPNSAPVPQASGTADEVSPPPAPAEPSADDVNPFGYTDGTPVGCMLPLVDVLNHRPRTGLTWARLGDRVAFILGHGQADGGSPAAGGSQGTVGQGGADTGAATASDTHPVSSSTTTSRRTVAVPTGHEVFNNYGPKSNEELILGYGFAIDGNEDDTFSLRMGLRLPVPFRPGADNWADSGTRVSQGNTASALPPSRHVITKRGLLGGHGLPESLLQTCRLAAAMEGSRDDDDDSGADTGSSSRSHDQPLTEAVVLARLGLQLWRTRERLIAAHPWLARPGGEYEASAPGEITEVEAGAAAAQASTASSAPPHYLPGFGPRSTYRRLIARLYVRGQEGILKLAVGHLQGMIEQAAGRQLSLNSIAVPSAAPGAAGDVKASPSQGLVVQVPRQLLHVEADDSGNNALVPLLTLPYSSVITPSRLPVLAPELAGVLDGVEGLSLGHGDGHGSDSDGVGGGAEDISADDDQEAGAPPPPDMSALPVQALHLALWLVGQWTGQGLLVRELTGAVEEEGGGTADASGGSNSGTDVTVPSKCARSVAEGGVPTDPCTTTPAAFAAHLWHHGDSRFGHGDAAATAGQVASSSRDDDASDDAPLSPSSPFVDGLLPSLVGSRGDPGPLRDLLLTPLVEQALAALAQREQESSAGSGAVGLGAADQASDCAGAGRKRGRQDLTAGPADTDRPSSKGSRKPKSAGRRVNSKAVEAEATGQLRRALTRALVLVQRLAVPLPMLNAGQTDSTGQAADTTGSGGVSLEAPAAPLEAPAAPLELALVPTIPLPRVAGVSSSSRGAGGAGGVTSHGKTSNAKGVLRLACTWRLASGEASTGDTFFPHGGLVLQLCAGLGAGAAASAAQAATLPAEAHSVTDDNPVEPTLDALCPSLYVPWAVALVDGLTLPHAWAREMSGLYEGGGEEEEGDDGDEEVDREGHS